MAAPSLFFVSLLTIATPDGLQLPGAWSPAPVSNSTTVILQGGASASLTYPLFPRLTRAMNDAGFDVLLLVTRGHDELWRQGADLTNHGHAVEEIHDCLLDFQGAIETAADLGAQRVIVAGHSMGAVKTWYGAAHLDDARVVGAVTISTPRLDPAYFARLPWASVYLGEMAEARHAVEAGNGDVLREWQTPFRRNLMAPRAWLDHYESDRYAARLLAPLIDVPVLAIEADGEENVLHQGYAAELAAAHSNVTARVVTDSGHMFRTPGALDRLASEVASWLGSRFGDVRS